MHVPFQIKHLLLDGEQLLVNGIAAQKILVLGQVAQGLSLREHGLAGVRLQLAHNDFQEGGLSGAVDADDGGLFPVFYMKGRVFQNDVRAKGFSDVLA